MSRSTSLMTRKQQVAIFALFGVVTLFFSIMILSLSMGAYGIADRFSNEGVRTDATVVMITTTKSHGDTYYILDIEYTAHGEIVSNTVRISSTGKNSLKEGLDVGDSMAIIYVASDPSIIMRADKSIWGEFTAMAIAVVVLLLIAIAFFIATVMSIRKLQKFGDYSHEYRQYYKMTYADKLRLSEDEMNYYGLSDGEKQRLVDRQNKYKGKNILLGNSIRHTDREIDTINDTVDTMSRRFKKHPIASIIFGILFVPLMLGLMGLAMYGMNTNNYIFIGIGFGGFAGVIVLSVIIQAIVIRILRSRKIKKSKMDANCDVGDYNKY